MKCRSWMSAATEWHCILKGRMQQFIISLSKLILMTYHQDFHLQDTQHTRHKDSCYTVWSWSSPYPSVLAYSKFCSVLQLLDESFMADVFLIKSKCSIIDFWHLLGVSAHGIVLPLTEINVFRLCRLAILATSSSMDKMSLVNMNSHDLLSKSPIWIVYESCESR